MKTCQKLLSKSSSFGITAGKSVAVTLFAMFLFSCSDAVNTVDEVKTVNSDINSEQLLAKVTIFPKGFYDSGYVENYKVVGTDDYGRVYSGTYEVRTGDKTVFNGVNAIPVVSVLSYSTIIDNVQLPPIVIALTQYFSFETPRQYLGNVNDATSIVLTLQGQASSIAESVVSNSSGQLASLVGSNSSLETISWSVVPGNSNTYNLIFDFNDTDSAGGLINQEVQTFEISPAGERLSWSMVSVIPSLNNTLRFSGSRI